MHDFGCKSINGTVNFRRAGLFKSVICFDESIRMFAYGYVKVEVSVHAYIY